MTLSQFHERVGSVTLIAYLHNPNQTVAQKCQLLLDDTVAYYGADPTARRAFTSSNLGNQNNSTSENCVYFNSEFTKACAIGRILPKLAINLIQDRLLHSQSIVGLKKDLQAENLWPNYLDELSLSFLLALQTLHDNQDNWDDLNNGLSERGQRIYESIKKLIDNI